MTKKAVAYPGQSAEARVGSGLVVWSISEGDEFPRADILTWRDAPYPSATHSPEEFLRAFPPMPGGVVGRQAEERDLHF
jgi:hypothetical protein